MQPPPPQTLPTPLALALRGVPYAGASAPSGNHGGHVGVIQPSTQGPRGAFAQWATSRPQPGPGVLLYGSNMGAGRVMNPRASTGHGHGQGHSHGHWHGHGQGYGQGLVQMPLMPPQTGSLVYQMVLLRGLPHIRNAPCDRCVWQQVKVAPRTPVNVIYDVAYPTWRFIILPDGQRGWTGLHNLQ